MGLMEPRMRVRQVEYMRCRRALHETSMTNTLPIGKGGRRLGSSARSAVFFFPFISVGARATCTCDPVAAVAAALPIGRVFVIDVSWSAVRSGMLYTVCEGIRRALYGPDGAENEGETGGVGISFSTKQERETLLTERL
jgi:hypothetical protein